MSPSAYRPTRLLLSAANQDLRMFNKPEITKVKRRLFGPVDPKATQKFIDEELKKISVTQSKKWNLNLTTESDLEPDGLYKWAPATPKKECAPIKRKLEPEVDITDRYCDLSDANVVRPKLLKCPSPTHNGEHKVQQSRITDFMKATKRPLDVTKKQSSSTSVTDWKTDVPTKIPRLDIAS